MVKMPVSSTGYVFRIFASVTLTDLRYGHRHRLPVPFSKIVKRNENRTLEVHLHMQPPLWSLNNYETINENQIRYTGSD